MGVSRGDVFGTSSCDRPCAAAAAAVDVTFDAVVPVAAAGWPVGPADSDRLCQTRRPRRGRHETFDRSCRTGGTRWSSLRDAVAAAGPRSSGAAVSADYCTGAPTGSHRCCRPHPGFSEEEGREGSKIH